MELQPWKNIPLDKLGSVLLQLLRNGRFKQVHLASEEERSGFQAEQSMCHQNVDRWIQTHPQHRAVLGYLAVPCSGGALFIKHSVVDTRSILLDITPRPSNESQSIHKFIEINGVRKEAFEKWPNQVSSESTDLQHELNMRMGQSSRGCPCNLNKI